jgi:signal transduction histidine kinase
MAQTADRRPVKPLEFRGTLEAAAADRQRRLRIQRALRPPAELRPLLPIVLPVGALGGALFGAATAWFFTHHPSWKTVVGVAALLAAAIIAEAFPVPIEGVAAGRTSFATIFIVGAAVVHGWSPATMIGFLTMAAVELGRRRRPSRIAFNTGMYASAAATAGAVAAALRGDDLIWIAAAAVAGATAFWLVDIGLLTAVIARSRKLRFIRASRRAITSTAPPFAIMASLTVILVVLWDRSPFAAVALIGPLVVIAIYQRRVHGVLERLRELDRMKNEFIAVVSHELRTPISSVYGAAMTLERHHLDEPGRKSLLAVIYGESARLARLVDQVLWASRLESGAPDAVLESCDPRELAAPVVEAARAHLPEGLRLELRAPPALPAVAADPEKVKQVLVNLIENAVKYSPSGGRVAVDLEPTAEHVRFLVRDEGIGIPVAEQHRVFDKFHRLDPELTRGVSGSGLGLYICRELVEQMNGRIWLVSQEGKGSTFAFELPLADHSGG